MIWWLVVGVGCGEESGRKHWNSFKQGKYGSLFQFEYYIYCNVNLHPDPVRIYDVAYILKQTNTTIFEVALKKTRNRLEVPACTCKYPSDII